jgi:Fibronectin type III domain
VNLVPPPKPTVSIVSDTSVMLTWMLTSSDVLFVKVQYKRVGNGRSESGWQTVDEDLPVTKQSFEVTELQPGELIGPSLSDCGLNVEPRHPPDCNLRHELRNSTRMRI